MRLGFGTGLGARRGRPSGAGAAAAPEVVTTFLDDPITATTIWTEREPNASWSYGANGAAMPDTGGFNQASISAGTVDTANRCPDPAVIADGKYTRVEFTLHAKTGTPPFFVHVYADSSLVNNVQDSFFAWADGTNIRVYKREGASDTQLATVAGTFVAGDRLACKVTKNGSNWDVAAEKNGTQVVAASAQAHGGTLGRIPMFECQNGAGQALTVKIALGTTNGA